MDARIDKAAAPHQRRAATVTLPSDREIVITRTFDAPRTLVFDAWTKPEHIAHWWDPTREPLAQCDVGTTQTLDNLADYLRHPWERTS